MKKKGSVVYGGRERSVYVHAKKRVCVVFSFVSSRSLERRRCFERWCRIGRDTRKQRGAVRERGGKQRGRAIAPLTVCQARWTTSAEKSAKDLPHFMAPRGVSALTEVCATPSLRWWRAGCGWGWGGGRGASPELGGGFVPGGGGRPCGWGLGGPGFFSSAAPPPPAPRARARAAAQRPLGLAEGPRGLGRGGQVGVCGSGGGFGVAVVSKRGARAGLGRFRGVGRGAAGHRGRRRWVSVFGGFRGYGMRSG